MFGGPFEQLNIQANSSKKRNKSLFNNFPNQNKCIDKDDVQKQLQNYNKYTSGSKPISTKLNYQFDNDDNDNQEANIENEFKNIKSIQNIINNEANQQLTKKITLKDLCKEDKAKVGQLIKRLAYEQQEKEQLRQKLILTQQSYEELLQKYKQQNEAVVKETKNLRQEFNQSLKLLEQQNQLMQSQQVKDKYQIRQQQNVDINQNNKVNELQLFEDISTVKSQNNDKKIDFSLSLNLKEINQSDLNPKTSTNSNKKQIKLKSNQNSDNKLKHSSNKSQEILIIKNEIETLSKSLRNMNFSTSRGDQSQRNKIANFNVLQEISNQKIKHQQADQSSTQKTQQNIDEDYDLNNNQKQNDISQQSQEYQQIVQDDIYISPNFKALMNQQENSSKKKSKDSSQEKNQKNKQNQTFQGKGNKENEDQDYQIAKQWIQQKRKQIEALELEQKQCKRKKQDQKVISNNQQLDQQQIVKSDSQLKLKDFVSSLDEEDLTNLRNALNNNQSNHQLQKGVLLNDNQNISDKDYFTLKQTQLNDQEQIQKQQCEETNQQLQNINQNNLNEKIKEFNNIKLRLGIAKQTKNINEINEEDNINVNKNLNEIFNNQEICSQLANQQRNLKNTQEMAQQNQNNLLIQEKQNTLSNQNFSNTFYEDNLFEILDILNDQQIDNNSNNIQKIKKFDNQEVLNTKIQQQDNQQNQDSNPIILYQKNQKNMLQNKSKKPTILEQQAQHFQDMQKILGNNYEEKISQNLMSKYKLIVTDISQGNNQSKLRKEINKCQ